MASSNFSLPRRSLHPSIVKWKERLIKHGIMETREDGSHRNDEGAPSNLVNRQANPDDTVIDVNGIKIGGEAIVIIAGPCAVENRVQLLETARAVCSGGAHILRGGAFKPRTSPYSFQGLGEEGLKYLSEARNETGLPVVKEVILCERGIRTFENYTRNTLDLSAVPVLKRRTHLPVIVDPSHATGHRWLVPIMAKAAIVAGADGIMVEVHNNPLEALSDGQQSLFPKEFGQLTKEIEIIAGAAGRKVYRRNPSIA